MQDKTKSPDPSFNPFSESSPLVLSHWSFDDGFDIYIENRSERPIFANRMPRGRRRWSQTAVSSPSGSTARDGFRSAGVVSDYRSSLVAYCLLIT